MSEELKPEDQPILITNRTSRGPSNVPNSVKGTCSHCKQEVWLSPSSQKVLGTVKLILCTDCGLEQLEREEAQSGEKSKLKLIPGQIEEINDYFRKN